MFISPMVKGDIKFAVCHSVSLSVWFASPSKLLKLRTWLRSVPNTVSPFCGDRRRSPTTGSENDIGALIVTFVHLLACVQ